MHRFYFQLVLISLFAFSFTACESESPTRKLKSSASKIDFSSPKSGAEFFWGDTIFFKLQVKQSETRLAQNVSLFINGELIHEEMGDHLDYTYISDAGSGGKVIIKGLVNFEDGSNSRRTIGIVINAKEAPAKMGYTIVNTFPHNTKDYTQGLVFNPDDGLLYEGTGTYTESRLVKKEIDTDEEIKAFELADEFFGEGITILNDTIYQLTYKNKKGFYYDLDFNLLGEFTYPSEGWGLTHNGKSLIMSDGSSNLYFISPGDFSIEKKIQVFGDKGQLSNLNELEYVNGIIYANIYTTEVIAKIDGQSGKLLALINMEGLLDEKQLKGKVDVLNGIAFNPSYQSFYITGKWWPQLFEVRFVEE